MLKGYQMDKAKCLGKMELTIKVTLLMEIVKNKEQCWTMMDLNTKVSGIMIANMDKES